MNFRTVLMTSVVAASALAQPAFAQDAEAGSGPRLEEIIVTAQKREQSLKDVPISIASFGEEKLAKMGIAKIEDLATSVPNLFINNFNGTADTVRLFIRGIGQNDVSVTQDPSVALYIDGVYVGSSFGAGFDAVDLERIEVLRGPQGTLYGRNATGGAINLITIKPNTEDVGGKVELSYGNYDYRNAKASLNLPIAKDVAALRVSGLISKRDGFYKNTGIGEDWAEQDRKAVRAALRVQPSSDLTFDYAFDYSQVKDTGGLSVPIAGAGPNVRIPVGGPATIASGVTAVPTLMFNYAGFPFSSKRPKSAESLEDYLPSKSNVWGHTFTAEWQASDRVTVRSITGYRKVDSQSFTTSLPTQTGAINLVVNSSTNPYLPVGTVVPYQGPWWLSATNAHTKYRNFSQELQVLGDADILGGNLGYVTGVYFYDDHGRQDAPGESIGGPRAEAWAEVDNQSLAAFTELTYTPGGKDGPFHVTLGARYSSDKREASRVNENSFSFAALGGFTAADCIRFASTFTALGQTCSGTGLVQGAAYKKKFHNFSPALTLAYDINPDVRVYAKVATGYKSGGTSQRSANPVNFSNGFEPEKEMSYEVGIKGDFFDRRVRFNMAAFYLKLDNYQASIQTGSTPGDRDFVGIDNSKIYGIEADLTVAVTQGLRLGGSMGLLHTKFGESSLLVLRDTPNPARPDGMWLENFIKPFSYAPKFSGTLSADYDREITDNWGLSAHVGYSYQGKMHTSTNLTDDRTLDARNIVDASISLIRRGVGGDGSVEVKLWGKNIFNEDYRTVALGSFAAYGAQTVAEFGDPRTYGVSLIGKF